MIIQKKLLFRCWCNISLISYIDLRHILRRTFYRKQSYYQVYSSYYILLPSSTKDTAVSYVLMLSYNRYISIEVGICSKRSAFPMQNFLYPQNAIEFLPVLFSLLSSLLCVDILQLTL